MKKAKSARQLDREIAASLSTQGQPSLAAMFADPKARSLFAQEMRHELQKQKTTRATASALTARPFTVKRFEQSGDRRIRDIVGRYATEAEARTRADAIGGWVEHDGRVVYGVAEES